MFDLYESAEVREERGPTEATEERDRAEAGLFESESLLELEEWRRPKVSGVALERTVSDGCPLLLGEGVREEDGIVQRMIG